MYTPYQTQWTVCKFYRIARLVLSCKSVEFVLLLLPYYDKCCNMFLPVLLGWFNVGNVFSLADSDTKKAKGTSHRHTVKNANTWMRNVTSAFTEISTKYHNCNCRIFKSSCAVFPIIATELNLPRGKDATQMKSVRTLSSGLSLSILKVQIKTRELLTNFRRYLQHVSQSCPLERSQENVQTRLFPPFTSMWHSNGITLGKPSNGRETVNQWLYEYHCQYKFT